MVPIRHDPADTAPGTRYCTEFWLVYHVRTTGGITRGERKTLPNAYDKHNSRREVVTPTTSHMRTQTYNINRSKTWVS